MAAKNECCYIGRGEIFLKECLTQAQIDNGEVAEFVSVGNTENFNLTSEVNTIVKKNYISKNGGIECSYSSIDDVQVNLTLCCYKDLNLKLALSADDIAVPDQAAIPAAPQSITQTVSGGAFAPITASPALDPAVAFTVTVDGADETADFTFADGVLSYTGASAPVDGEVVVFSYTSLPVDAVVASTKYNLFTASSKIYQLQFRGCNAQAGGEDIQLDLWQVSFEPSSEFQFITEEFGTIELVGRVQPDRTRVISDGTTDFPSEYGSFCRIPASA